MLPGVSCGAGGRHVCHLVSAAIGVSKLAVDLMVALVVCHREPLVLFADVVWRGVKGAVCSGIRDPQGCPKAVFARPRLTVYRCISTVAYMGPMLSPAGFVYG